MGSLIKLAAWVLIEFARTGRVRVAAVRMTAAALCTGLAVVLMLAALGCLVTALWMFVLPSLGPVGAPLVVAATLSAATLVLAVAVWLIIRHGRRKQGAATEPQLLLSGATRLFNEHKGAVLLAAIVAGMAAASGGRKP